MSRARGPDSTSVLVSPRQGGGIVRTLKPGREPPQMNFTRAFRTKRQHIDNVVTKLAGEHEGRTMTYAVST